MRPYKSESGFSFPLHRVECVLWQRLWVASPFLSKVWKHTLGSELLMLLVNSFNVCFFVSHLFRPLWSLQGFKMQSRVSGLS